MDQFVQLSLHGATITLFHIVEGFEFVDKIKMFRNIFEYVVLPLGVLNTVLQSSRVSESIDTSSWSNFFVIDLILAMMILPPAMLSDLQNERHLHIRILDLRFAVSSILLCGFMVALAVLPYTSHLITDHNLAGNLVLTALFLNIMDQSKTWSTGQGSTFAPPNAER